MLKANRFVIVIPSYQNIAWCEKNLLSALNQNYSNFRIVYADDCSSDGTADAVERIISEHDSGHKVTLIKNTKRILPIGNTYNAIHSCDDDEIVILLDGDDWLAHNDVLSRVNKEYNEKDVWVTYGQWISYSDNSHGGSREIPNSVISSNSFRRYEWCSSHLRTHYAWLYKMIRKEDLMCDGDWFKAAGDLATMFPMLELAGPKQSFIPDILYVYNYTSPINEAKVDRTLQIACERKIRSMPPYKMVVSRQ
jgi:glycosyltransferase involved in cell wall biosynthesis